MVDLISDIIIPAVLRKRLRLIQSHHHIDSSLIEMPGYRTELTTGAPPSTFPMEKLTAV